MANIPHRYRDIIYDYSAYDTTKILLDGEIRYFNTILTGITHPCSIIGDGVNKIEDLPFRENINIETALNINLGVLEISRNRVSIYNTAIGIITVTTSTGIFLMESGEILNLKFDGTDWIRNPTLFNILDSIKVTGNIAIADTFFSKKYRIQGAHTITLPTVADNEGIEFWFWNEGDHAAVIDGEGAEIFTFQHGGTATAITFAKEGDWIHIVSDGSTWLVIGGYWGYTTATLTDGSGTANGGGAYTDSAFTYDYWYENGMVNFIGWGWIEVTNANAYVIVDITSPITFTVIKKALAIYNGYKTSDPASLVDTAGVDTNNTTQLRMADTSSILVSIRKTSGNFTNGHRLLFSVDLTGTI